MTSAERRTLKCTLIGAAVALVVAGASAVIFRIYPGSGRESPILLRVVLFVMFSAPSCVLLSPYVGVLVFWVPLGVVCGFSFAKKGALEAVVIATGLIFLLFAIQWAVYSPWARPDPLERRTMPPVRILDESSAKLLTEPSCDRKGRQS